MNIRTVKVCLDTEDKSKRDPKMHIYLQSNSVWCAFPSHDDQIILQLMMNPPDGNATRIPSGDTERIEWMIERMVGDMTGEILPITNTTMEAIVDAFGLLPLTALQEQGPGVKIGISPLAVYAFSPAYTKGVLIGSNVYVRQALMAQRNNFVSVAEPPELIRQMLNITDQSIDDLSGENLPKVMIQ